MTGPVFANSAIVRAPERLVLKRGAWRLLDIKVRYGLWQHPSFGPVLVDTGYGTRVTQGSARSTALKIYASLFGPKLVEPDQLAAGLAARGLTHRDVEAVIVTHFHGDHIAALRDLPTARFFASGVAFDALCAMSTRRRLAQGVFMELLPDDFAAHLVRIETLPEVALPFGLGTGHDLFGDGSCLTIALPGHAIGHVGVVWPHLSPPLLYAVDVQWLWRAISEDRPPGLPARLIFADWPAALTSSDKVRRFAAAGGEVVLCHEPGRTPRDV